MTPRDTLFIEDPYLSPYRSLWEERWQKYDSLKAALTDNREFSECFHDFERYGVIRTDRGWRLREWLPGASEVFLLCQYTDWEPKDVGRFTNEEDGDWIIDIPGKALGVGEHFRLHVRWEGGEGDRIPAYATQVHRDDATGFFTAQVPDKEPFSWKSQPPAKPEHLYIYEVHIGMAQEEPGVGTFRQFKEKILPRIMGAGYNAIQFMALMEHPYYASFGYQVSSFFALSSRFGTPRDFKELVDACHGAGLVVIMDLVHSHAVKNQIEGLSHQDGSDHAYFHKGERGYHPVWDSRCFDYGKEKVLRFLLSNCRWWLSEYKLDGFRLDGVTSMVYRDHGIGVRFSDYGDYFNDNVDNDALIYLMLANEFIHKINPQAITIAEDMSGFPGMARPVHIGGVGFDFRLNMGLPDFWVRLLETGEDRNVEKIWDAMTNRRYSEKQIAYAESHDQAMVGDKTIAFRLMDASMYDHMLQDSQSEIVDSGMGLHKLIRLLTFSLGGDGYLNFMGNEFGHPEWIDFPREGNHWSHNYARRQWSLVDNPMLRYRFLAAFDKAMLSRCATVFDSSYANKVYSHVYDHVLIYTRNKLLFLINLEGYRDYGSYGVPFGCKKLTLILNSDDIEYGGKGKEIGCSYHREEKKWEITLPALTALVFSYE